MDIESIIQGGGCVISGVALAKLLDAALRAWSARNQRAEVRPQGRPDTFPVDVADKYVTRNEFEKHVKDNAGDHESLFGRLNRNDRETSEIKGMLSTIIDDLRSIKNFMMTRGAK
ncbi:MAG: hypothetical protein IJK04_07555 [Kiritimatiellae bacterium]|nr:hypothetical protein [Kiritimatiellia bacterium]